MGFKCPVCFRDFMQNKEAMIEHTKVFHRGIGNDIVKLVDKITKEPPAENQEERHSSYNSRSTQRAKPRSAHAAGRSATIATRKNSSYGIRGEATGA
jgi:hypothetical protein